MASTLWSLLLLGGLLLLAGAIGEQIAQRCRLFPPSAGRVDRFLVGLAIGLGVIAYTTAAVGLAGLLRPLFLLGVLGALGVICLRPGIAAVRRAVLLSVEALSYIAGMFRGGRTRRWRVWLTVCLALAAIYTLTLLIESLAPPAGSDYDALAYHLALPALYLRWGRIHYDPYIPHSNWPQVTEMLYLVMLAGGAQSARTVHLILGLLAAGACWSLARPYGRRAALAAALVFWFTPVVGWEAGAGYDDLSFTFFQALAFLACLRFHQSGARENRWIWLAGLSQGLALGVKYTALALAPLLVIAFFVPFVTESGEFEPDQPGVPVEPEDRRTPRTSGVRRRLRAGILAGVIAAVAASPWYLRTWVWTGNPVFPFYYSLLGGRNWSRDSEAFYRNLQTGYGTGHALGYSSGHGALDLVSALWHLLTVPQYFFEPGASLSFGVILGSLGVGYLLLPVLLSLTGGWRRTSAVFAILFLGFFLEWYGLMQQVRYLIPALPLLAPVWALALAPGIESRRVLSMFQEAGASECPSAPDLRGSKAAAVILLLSFAWTAFQFGSLTLGSSRIPGALAVDLGLVSREEYLSAALPDLWPVSNWINMNLPGSARIALIKEPRGYYIQRDTLWANGHEGEKLKYDAMETAPDLVRALRSQGIGYVLIRLGGRYGLIGAYAMPGAKLAGADWRLLDTRLSDAHWAVLYRDAVQHGLLTQVYPPSDLPTDSHGYAIYQVGPARRPSAALP